MGASTCDCEHQIREIKEGMGALLAGLERYSFEVKEMRTTLEQWHRALSRIQRVDVGPPDKAKQKERHHIGVLA